MDYPLCCDNLIKDFSGNGAGVLISSVWRVTSDSPTLRLRVSRLNHFLFPKIFFSSPYVILIGTSLSGYANINAPQTETQNLDARRLY